MRQGHFAAADGFSIQGAVAQVSVKTVWPDGSAKFAILAGTVELLSEVEATLLITPGRSRQAGAHLTSAQLRSALTAPVTLSAGAFGSATWSGDDWLAPLVQWVRGDEMASWVYRKPIGADAHLVAWLEVRFWRSGEVEVLPWVENGFLLRAGATSKAATFAFSMGGTERTRVDIDLPHHTRTPILQGTITAHWLGPSHELAVRHEPSYLESTRLVPAYFGRTSATAAVVAGLPTRFEPLQRGSWPTAMGSGGYHASIGLLPEWDALPLTVDPAAAGAVLNAVVWNGYSAGRYPIHFRDETSPADPHRPPRLSLHPGLNIRRPEPGWETTPETSGTAPAGWSLSHQPSAGFMAYLLTGRRYFLEEVQMAASANALFESSTQREQGLGLFKSTAAGAARHVAWCWRTLAQALAITPDDEVEMRDEYLAQFTNNLASYHSTYVAQPNNPQGWVAPYSDYNGGIGGTVVAGSTSSSVSATPGALYGVGYNLTADNQYVGWRVTIGTETRTVAGSTMATDTLTLSQPLSAAPAAGTAFSITDGAYFEATWMQDFVTAAWGYSMELGLPLDAHTNRKLSELFAWKARSVVGRFGDSSSSAFLFRDAAPYSIAVAPSDAPDFVGGTGPWFSTWGQVYDATFGGQTPGGGKPPPYAAPGARAEGGLRMWLSPEGYLANATPALSYAVRHRAPGAEAALARLTSSPGWAEVLVGFNAEPVWGVAPAPRKPRSAR